MERTVLIVGGGMFGLTAALELRRRNWRVTLLDPEPIPRPTAASTDISKVVRADYGSDELYTALGEASLAGWRLWNLQWGEALFHEDGFLLMRRDAMTPGCFEHESFTRLAKRGFPVRRVKADGLRAQFPAWAPERFVDGYLSERAGWAESGKVVARLAVEVRDACVIVREGAGFARLIERGSRVTGVVTTTGEELRADLVLIAAGAWTPTLLPHLADVMWATAQPVLHFKVAIPAEWQAPRFPVWAADISRTGWYGFPALADGTVKVANHGPGRRVHPDEPRVIWAGEEERFRAFLRDTFPALADAPLVASRTCLYCDTFDGNFWIAHDAQREGLVVAAGDSGHGFKFAPVMGGLIADVVERRPNAMTARFAWRSRDGTSKEGARAD
jgi:glycine/D-amino acid oxidase-like deaminating enzyme